MTSTDTPPSAGDDFPARYDAFIDWPARLARELPLLTGLLESAGARRVLDVACGTGRHAIELARRGCAVVGLDSSRAMVAHARALAAAAGVDVAFAEQDMRRLDARAIAASLGGPADAAICLGNALPQLDDRRRLRAALRGLRRCLREGGLAILHQRNWQRVLSKRERWMPLRAATIDGRPWLFERFLDFLPRRRITLNAIWLEQAPEGWRAHRHTVPMRAWLPEDIDREARGLFERIAIHGAFDGGALEPLESADCIWVGRALARRSGGRRG